MVNSSEILAEQAQALYGRLPKPVNFTTLINEQIAPELIGAIRLIASGEKKTITENDIRRLQAMGGRDHCDPTLTGSPIAKERPYQTTILR